ncbi:ParA family protein [Paludisphaera mucosa]|uniref:ParA family protein n=1 Tax=Paludisphaera mucosa TaxID=3030827 RepID=A0ABT6FLE2_9BACT|nr:ParA family protein [Paludisphaera mucosa]MDG3008372.1 ParA family protein [Paludisphaera mucosa]
MLVVTLLNQKGGVGKTSCTHHLSGTLASVLGKRVLIVDADPQASLTQGWWGPSATRTLDPSSTIAPILAGDLPHPGQVIHETGLAGLHLVPGSRAASVYNVADPTTASRESRETLREFLVEVAGDYDLALIDCPPNLYGCSFAALAASNHLVVPVQPEDYGAQGIADVLDSLDLVRSEGYPVTLLGYLLTMVQSRRALHQVYEANVREAYGDLVFAARMPEAAEFPEAIAQRKTITQYKPKGAAAKAIRAIAEELLSRTEGVQPTAKGVAA